VDDAHRQAKRIVLYPVGVVRPRWFVGGARRRAARIVLNPARAVRARPEAGRSEPLLVAH
jgi:hypothetical protein